VRLDELNYDLDRLYGLKGEPLTDRLVKYFVRLQNGVPWEQIKKGYLISYALEQRRNRPEEYSI
jgi:hypothetical protein